MECITNGSGRFSTDVIIPVVINASERDAAAIARRNARRAKGKDLSYSDTALQYTCCLRTSFPDVAQKDSVEIMCEDGRGAKDISDSYGDCH